MAGTRAVKRALAALATRTATARKPYVALVDEAAAALDDVERAAEFVDAVGLERLEAAVDAAEADAAVGVAERGRDALATYRSFREVVADESANHFHRGAGTDKRRYGQGSRR